MPTLGKTLAVSLNSSSGQRRFAADYVNAIREEPEFLHTDTSWNFILVASEFEPEIESRIYKTDLPHGLFLNGDNFQFRIKTWAEVDRCKRSALRTTAAKI